ncbi:MAG: hypothetical protein JXM75_01540 [Chromatiaceae bacterium]|nr:hypothetical protein [Chromatiaceae bacterium]
MKVGIPGFRSIALGCLLTLAAVSSALAESPCKGLEQDVCGAREDCRWINGYTRKDGIEVSGHCRVQKKAQSQATTPAQTPPPKSESSASAPTAPADS